MLIATFTSGEKTLIGIKVLSFNAKIRTIDSRFLYADPEKFAHRFLSILSNLFEISSLSKDVSLIFSISGNIDTENSKIIESSLLNELSERELFDNFDFHRVFNGIIDSRNILVLNSSNSVAFGLIANKTTNIPLPALLIQIDHNVEANIIKESGIQNYESALRPIKHLENKTAKSLLCDEGIKDILFEQTTNIAERYTQNLIGVVDNFIQKGKEDNFEFKTIFIHTSRREFILRNLVEKKYKKNNLSISEGNSWFGKLISAGLDIPSGDKIELERFQLKTRLGNKLKRFVMKNEEFISFGVFFPGIGPLFSLGAVAFLEVKNYFHNKVTGIVYFSSTGDKKAEFKNFIEFRSHWSDVESIAASESYYLVKYKDDSKMKVYLDSINSISDLQQYQF